VARAVEFAGTVRKSAEIGLFVRHAAGLGGGIKRPRKGSSTIGIGSVITELVGACAWRITLPGIWPLRALCVATMHPTITVTIRATRTTTLLLVRQESDEMMISDGTIALDMDPLSLLCRLAATVPPPRFHTVRYGGVLSSHANRRPLIVPKPAPDAPGDATRRDRIADTDVPKGAGVSRYRPWAELLRRTFGIEVETCPKCAGRMRLLALITDPKNVARFLRHPSEPLTRPPMTQNPARADIPPEPPGRRAL
jgi:hypothetical protein